MSSTIDAEAIASLTAAVEDLLADTTDSSVMLISLVAPERILPTGLGALIGINEEPRGEVLGRRLEAVVTVTIQANDVDTLDDSVGKVTLAFLGADRAMLLQRGILKVALDDVGPRSAQGSESAQTVTRDLRFRVLYEFLKIPDEPEEIIEKVSGDLYLDFDEAQQAKEELDAEST